MNWKFWISVAAIGMALSWSPTAVAADRDKLMDVVRDIEIELAGVSEHAAKLEQWVNMPHRYTLGSYQYEWSGLRERFNAAGELVPKLQKASEGSNEWQKEAVNQMASLMKALEGQIDAARTQVFDTKSVERLYTNDMYELRVESIVYYSDHIDGLIEYLQSRPTSSEAPPRTS